MDKKLKGSVLVLIGILVFFTSLQNFVYGGTVILDHYYSSKETDVNSSKETDVNSSEVPNIDSTTDSDENYTIDSGKDGTTDSDENYTIDSSTETATDSVENCTIDSSSEDFNVTDVNNTTVSTGSDGKGITDKNSEDDDSAVPFLDTLSAIANLISALISGYVAHTGYKMMCLEESHKEAMLREQGSYKDAQDSKN